MIVKPHTRSFAAGEITPELYGRIDLTKRTTGVAKCLNFWVLPHGPLANKLFSNLRVYPGTEHPHAPQNPEILDVAAMNPKNKR